MFRVKNYFTFGGRRQVARGENVLHSILSALSASAWSTLGASWIEATLNLKAAAGSRAGSRRTFQADSTGCRSSCWPAEMLLLMYLTGRTLSARPEPRPAGADHPTSRLASNLMSESLSILFVCPGGPPVATGPGRANLTAAAATSGPSGRLTFELSRRIWWPRGWRF